MCEVVVEQEVVWAKYSVGLVASKRKSRKVVKEEQWVIIVL